MQIIVILNKLIAVFRRAVQARILRTAIADGPTMVQDAEKMMPPSVFVDVAASMNPRALSANGIMHLRHPQSRHHPRHHHHHPTTHR